MARKKSNSVETTETTPTTEAVAVAEPAPAADQPMERPAYIDGPPTHTADDEPTAPPSNWSDPYKRIFSSTAKGFEMGEHRRFKQRVFIFNERPEPEVIDVLKSHGFTYRPAEKAWTIPANPETRRLSEMLAYQFAGEEQGRDR